MRIALIYLLDGILTGSALAAGGFLLSLMAGVDALTYSAWLFYAGAALLGIAAISGLAGHGRSSGVLGWLGRLPDPTEDDVKPLPRQILVDKFVTTRNIWLTAAMTLLAFSFAILFAFS